MNRMIMIKIMYTLYSLFSHSHNAIGFWGVLYIKTIQVIYSWDRIMLRDLDIHCFNAKNPHHALHECKEFKASVVD